MILSSLIDAPTVDEGTILWTEAKTSIAQVYIVQVVACYTIIV